MQRFRNRKYNCRQRFNATQALDAIATPVLTDATAQRELEQIVQQLHHTVMESCDGRGIVICAGGPTYYLCAWVCINMLRYLGCQLPIELWYLDEAELNVDMRCMVEPLGVRCVNASELPSRCNIRRLFGRELKAFALLNSRFREVLLLDADNVPVADPTFLFDSSQFRDTGAIFWPDITRLPLTASLWQLSGVSARLEPEFETGQILLNKMQCFNALALTMWFNEHSDFWYQYTGNEKETFHMAWRKLDQPYIMPSHEVYALPATMCQHDFDGRRIFQHRRNAKWLIRRNRNLRGFMFESQCIGFIEQLSARWHEISGIHIYHPSRRTDGVTEAARQLCNRKWLYCRVGYDQRSMSFRPDGTVGDGAAALERFWNIQELTEPYRIVLDIQSQECRTCRLILSLDGIWEGRWDEHERMPVELVPITASSTGWQYGWINQVQRLIRDFCVPRLSGHFLYCGSPSGDLLQLAESLLLHEWKGLFVVDDLHVSFLLQARYASTGGVDIITIRNSGDGREPLAAVTSPDSQPSKADRVISASEYILIEPRAASHRDNISLVPHFAACTNGKDICVVLIDSNSNNMKLICEAMQSGIRPHLIFYQRNHDDSAIQVFEAFLMASNYIQIYTAVEICGWALLPRSDLVQSWPTFWAQHHAISGVIEGGQL